MVEKEEKQPGSEDTFEPKVCEGGHNTDQSQPDSINVKKESSEKQEETGQQEKISEVMARTRPKQIISECLKKSFSNIDDIKNFCFMYFEDVHKEIQNDGHSAIITKILQYCYAHDCFESLWEGLKRERLNHYNTYYSMWEKAEKTNSYSNNQKFSRGVESSRYIDHAGNESESHPLSNNDKTAINNWFHNELDSEEKSMVLTVALFQGINRKYMISISNEIQSILFKAS